MCFAASREGHLLDILSYVHVRRLTPSPGLIFHVCIENTSVLFFQSLIIFHIFFVVSFKQSLIAAAMVLYGTIDSLIDFFSFTAWIFYGGAMVALIVMRYTKPNAPRPYRVIISATKLHAFQSNSNILPINKLTRLFCNV